jgi:hypothetical protein
MRSAILTSLVLATLGCSAATSARQPGPSTLTRADSARITAAYLAGAPADSARYAALRELLAPRDSVEAAAKANPRRYINLRVF